MLCGRLELKVRWVITICALGDLGRRTRKLLPTDQLPTFFHVISHSTSNFSNIRTLNYFDSPIFGLVIFVNLFSCWLKTPAPPGVSCAAEREPTIS